MCGRYTLTSSPEEISEHYGLSIDPAAFTPSYNIAPAQDAPVIRYFNGIGRRLDRIKWGLVPSWSKDIKISSRLINARSETIAEKPAFRSAFKKRRCLIPTNGFYEWKPGHAGKQPYWIGLQDRSIFSFAGIWEVWTDKESGHELETFSIITTSPNKKIKALHDRMPVIVPEEKYKYWLDATSTPDGLVNIMIPFESDNIVLYPVSRLVNNPANNYENLLMPVNIN